MKQPSVLVVAAKWWPLSARLAIALIDHGCCVSAVCPQRHPLTHVSGIHRIYRYAGIFSLASLRRALHEAQPEVVIPADDGVVGQLHVLHQRDPDLRSLIERSLGSPDGYPVIRSRYELLALARALGLRIPETRKVNDVKDLRDWQAQTSATVVLKVDGESGGNGVRICHTLSDSVSAWRKLRVRSGYATAWKRLIVDRNPLTLWQRYTATAPEVTVQEFIQGRPANAMMVCRDGELLSLISVVVVTAESAVGAATVVRVIDDERMTLAGRRLASRLRLSGFFGLDFMLDASGVPVLIEMNPRCTQLGHFELPGRPSLVGVFSAAMQGVPPRPPRYPIFRKTIALFPQALAGGEVCAPYVAASYLDVPTQEPRLRRELELPSWPRRHWMSRIYHHFAPSPAAKPVVFEPISAVAGADDSVIAEGVAAVITR